VRPQSQAGYRTVLVQLPLGDLTSEQMRALGEIARRFGNGTMRATDDQNVVVPWVAEGAVPAVHAALVDADLANPDVATINDVVSCPGMDYCSLAITRSMGMAERIRHRLETTPMEVAGHASVIVTASIGIAGIDVGTSDAVLSPAALIDRADRALYQAKHLGRNRIEMWDAGGSEPRPVEREH